MTGVFGTSARPDSAGAGALYDRFDSLQQALSRILGRMPLVLLLGTQIRSEVREK